MSGDVIEIRSPNISIVAVTPGGVSVRQAKIFIKTSHTEEEGHIRIHGLKDLRRVSILRCRHRGCVAFRDCDLLPAKELHVVTREKGVKDMRREGAELVFSQGSLKCWDSCVAPKGWKVAARTIYNTRSCLDNWKASKAGV